MTTAVMLVTEVREPMKAILRSGFLALAMMLAKTVTVHADAFDCLVVCDHRMEP